MSEIDEIKTVKVYLEDVDCSAIAMTSGAGACSLMNEPFILKSKDKSVSLTEEQIEILKKIGEYDIVTKTKKEEVMDEKIVKELKDENAALKKQLDEIKKEALERELKEFSFEEEFGKDVAKALFSLDEEAKKIIIKAFFKLNKVEQPDNALQKQLSEEAGEDGDAEIIEKDLNTRIKEARENK